MRLLAFIAAVAFSATSFAQYPTKPPKLFVGFVPGGGVDQTARITVAALAPIWNQQIIVENKTGAGGTIAAEAVAKSPPDGYTLVLCNIGSHGIGPVLYKKLGYDALADVTHIGLIGVTPNVLAVHPSVPAAIEAAPGTPEQFSAFARGELVKWAKVVKEAGVTAD